MAVIDTVTSPTGELINIVDDNDQGFNSLDAESFMSLLITQLQNQDPTEPTSNEALLTQISQMRSLQASVELEDSIQGLSQGQLSAATAEYPSLIGKLIEFPPLQVPKAEGDDPDAPSEFISEGKVERVILNNGKASVAIGNVLVPVENITSVQE